MELSQSTGPTSGPMDYGRQSEQGTSPADPALAGKGRRGRAALANTVLLLFSVAVALAVAEVAVRIVAPQQLIVLRPDIWHGVDTLGWFRRPLVQSIINTGERTVNIITDRHGFRVASTERVQSDVKILLLGDSFMEALQVEHAQSTAGLLERRLSEATGQSVAVHNAGQGGWDPNHYSLAARKFLASEQYAAVVVALYVGNDVVSQGVEYFPPRSPIQRHRLHWPRGFGWKELVDAFLYPINDFLEVRSHLFILLKSRARPVLMRTGLTAAYFPLTFRTDHADYDWWNVTAEICRGIADLAAARGIPTLFALVPAPQQVDAQAFEEYLRAFGLDPNTVDLEQPNQMLGRALTTRGLEVIDPLEIFRNTSDNETRLYGAVDNHFSSDGHDLFAGAIAPAIVRHLAGATGPGRAGDSLR